MIAADQSVDNAPPAVKPTAQMFANILGCVDLADTGSIDRDTSQCNTASWLRPLRCASDKFGKSIYTRDGIRDTDLPDRLNVSLLLLGVGQKPTQLGNCPVTCRG